MASLEADPAQHSLPRSIAPLVVVGWSKTHSIDRYIWGTLASLTFLLSRLGLHVILVPRMVAMIEVWTRLDDVR